MHVAPAEQSSFQLRQMQARTEFALPSRVCNYRGALSAESPLASGLGEAVQRQRGLPGLLPYKQHVSVFILRCGSGLRAGSAMRWLKHVHPRASAQAIGTVAILAQGTSWAVAVTQAYFVVGSIPVRRGVPARAP